MCCSFIVIVPRHMTNPEHVWALSMWANESKIKLEHCALYIVHWSLWTFWTHSKRCNTNYEYERKATSCAKHYDCCYQASFERGNVRCWPKWNALTHHSLVLDRLYRMKCHFIYAHNNWHALIVTVFILNGTNWALALCCCFILH